MQICRILLWILGKKDINSIWRRKVKENVLKRHRWIINLHRENLKLKFRKYYDRKYQNKPNISTR